VLDQAAGLLEDSDRQPSTTPDTELVVKEDNDCRIELPRAKDRELTLLGNSRVRNDASFHL
jgi:hypothetical protein